MENRLSERIPCNLNATIMSEDGVFDGVIENVSECGVEYLITSSIISAGDFTPQKIIKLNFQIPSGEKLNLECEVEWFLKTPENKDKSLILGMKIIDPPEIYKDLVDKNC